MSKNIHTLKIFSTTSTVSYSKILDKHPKNSFTNRVVKNTSIFLFPFSFLFSLKDPKKKSKRKTLVDVTQAYSVVEMVQHVVQFGLYYQHFILLHVKMKFADESEILKRICSTRLMQLDKNRTF